MKKRRQREIVIPKMADIDSDSYKSSSSSDSSIEVFKPYTDGPITIYK